jgi:hypothetical protein
MAIDFPVRTAGVDPYNIADTYTFNNHTWFWNGTGWQAIANAGLVINSVSVPLVYNGSNRSVGLQFGQGLKLNLNNLVIDTSVVPTLAATTNTFSGTMVASKFKLLTGDSTGFLKADGTVDKSTYLTANTVAPEIIPFDSLENDFDGKENRFLLKYQGVAIPVTNPLRLLISLNGIIQTVSFPDYVWLSPLGFRGIQVNESGYIRFGEPVPAGSTFTGRYLSGPSTTTYTTLYPFKVMDIAIGD